MAFKFSKVSTLHKSFWAFSLPITVYNSLHLILICFNMKTENISLISQISRKFCESTSLHGYSYIANTNSIIMKIMWLVVILCLSAIGVKFLVVNTHEYMESRLSYSIESSSASLEVSWETKLKELKSLKRSHFNSSNWLFFSGGHISEHHCLQLEQSRSILFERKRHLWKFKSNKNDHEWIHVWQKW